MDFIKFIKGEECIESSFQYKYEGKGYSCDCILRETINYNLVITVSTGCVGLSETRKNRWMAYWEPKYYKSFYNNPKVIGENTGLGQLSLLEALVLAFEARDKFLK